MTYFESERLIFRDWTDNDLDIFIAINKDKDVMKYFPNTLSNLESISFYEKIKKEFQELGYGLYAVETKHNKEFIGFIGFHKASFISNFTPCIEIGWRLIKEVWGKGYASEGAYACLQYGFDILGFGEIYSFTAVANTKSEKVMKKIGMTQASYFDHPNVEKQSDLLKHVLYLIKIKKF